MNKDFYSLFSYTYNKNKLGCVNYEKICFIYNKY